MKVTESIETKTQITLDEKDIRKAICDYVNLQLESNTVLPSDVDFVGVEKPMGIGDSLSVRIELKVTTKKN